MRMTTFGFLSAAADNPTTPKSVAVAISSDMPLWISFRFICWFCVGFVLVLFLHFGFGSGNRCWPRDARKPRGMATFAERSRRSEPCCVGQLVLADFGDSCGGLDLPSRPS